MEKELQIPDSTGLTFEKVWLMMQKSDERFEKRMQKEREERIAGEKREKEEREKEREERIASDKKEKEERAEREKERAEREKERAEREKERAEREKEREKVFEKERIERAAQWEKDNEETKKLKEMIFGLGNNLGQITEDYFYNSVASNKKVGGIKYDQILRNFKIEQKKINAEYDIVLINSSRLLIIEIKQKPHINDIDKLITKQLPNFKIFFPYYSDFKIYGAIAGMTFDENVLKYAKKNGLYILTQNQDSKNMQLLNEEDFEAKEF